MTTNNFPLIFPKRSDYPQKLDLLNKKNDSILYRQIVESSASAYFETNIITRYFFRKRFEEALKFIPKKNYLEILDAGCGIGFFLPTLSQFAKNIHAIDYAEHSLSYAKYMCKKRKVKNIHFQKVNLTDDFPFKKQAFDLIICLSVLEHIKNLEKVMVNFRRVLQKNGILIVGYPNEDNLIFRFFQYFEKRLFRPKVFETFQGTKLIHISSASKINAAVKKYFFIEETKNIGLLPNISFYIIQKCRSI